MSKLERGDPVKIAVFGGSITRAHGVTHEEGWAFQLAEVLNEHFPTGEGKEDHKVVNLAVHGANICYCALTRYIELLFSATLCHVPLLCLLITSLLLLLLLAHTYRCSHFSAQKILMPDMR